MRVHFPLALTYGQRLVLLWGALAAALSLVYVPFVGANLASPTAHTVPLGYSLVWDPPNTAKACIQFFDMSPRLGETAPEIKARAQTQCEVKQARSEAYFNLLQVAVMTFVLLVMVGVTSPRRRPADRLDLTHGEVQPSEPVSLPLRLYAAASLLRFGVASPRAAARLEDDSASVGELLGALERAEGPDGTFIARDDDAELIRRAMGRLS